MSNNIDYSLSPAVRRRLAGMRHQTISSRDTGGRSPSLREKCRRCKEPFPLGVLTRGLCSFCRADLNTGDASSEDLERYRIRR